MKTKKLFSLFLAMALFAITFSSCDDDEKNEPFIPSAVVTNLSFTDTDDTEALIGGNLTWTLPSPETDITGYVVYLGNTDKDKATKVAEVAAGVSSYEIAKGTAYQKYVLVVAKNVVGESENIVSLAIPDSIKGIPVAPTTVGFFILNRGNQDANNASISYYDMLTKTLTPNFYQKVNGNGLGDSAEQMLIYGSKIYVAVTNSNRLAILDMNGKLLKSIEPKEGTSTKQPRCFAAADGKVYVSYFYGHSVAMLDTTSLEVEKEVKVGRYPEQLVVANKKLYVANSGGLDFPNYGETVSVIDIPTFKVEKDIKVALNPNRLAANSKGDVYVISMGDYGAVKNTLQKIDATTGTVKVMGEGSRISIANDKLYVLYAPYSTPDQNSISRYDALTGEKEADNLVSSISKVSTLSGIDVDPLSGNIYITDAPYTETGSVYVFDAEGKKVGEPIETKGYGPQAVCFVVK